MSVAAAISRSATLIDYSIYNNIHNRHKFQEKTILADKSLTKNEKTKAIRHLNKDYDREKIIYNEGTKRICENCKQECLATLCCEHCVRNYLIAKFSNWTSGNNYIDNLIQECQSKTLMTDMVVEWIPYNNLQNIEYLTRGGCSEIYSAIWIGGGYDEWDSKEQQLKRFGTIEVILKSLENVENANQRWHDEAKSHLTISNKWPPILQCYGLTQNPSSGNYMLVMMKMNIDLKEYLRQNYNQLTWKEKIRIINDIIIALFYIHRENEIHRDLHSGNILYSQFNDRWYISDLGFCGPADKSLKSVYGNLPYVAPEVIDGKEYTFKSDIYSIAILMCEISSGQIPFINYKHDYYLAINIINGIRPKIVPETPLEYKKLMEQCWDANPLKRPDIRTLWKKIEEIKLLYQFATTKDKNIKKNFKKFNSIKSNKNNKDKNNLKLNETSSLQINHTSSRLYKLYTSKIHQFENLPEPKNATEEEQEEFHSKPYEFNIPNNIDDFDNSSNQSYVGTSKTKAVLKDLQNDYKRETMEQQLRKQNIDINDK